MRPKPFLILLLFSTVFFSSLFLFTYNIPLAYSAPKSDLGLGVCHWPGPEGLRFQPEVNWFYWGSGGGQNWKDIEPAKGKYTFEKLDRAFESHFRQYPNTFVLLNINTAAPDAVPSWTKNFDYGFIMGPHSNASSFAPWNSNYQVALKKLLLITGQHIRSPQFKYKSRIKGVIIMGGGWYGEMIIWADKTSRVYRDWKRLGYTDDRYFEALMRIISFYAEAFPEYPLILQISSGLNGSEKFLEKVVKEVNRKYGPRVYLKWNGWLWNKPEFQLSKYRVLKEAAKKTPVGLEPAHSPSGISKATLLEAIIRTLNEIPASFFCLQNEYYQIFNWQDVRRINSLLTNTSSPTPTPPLPQARCELLKQKGDANCDRWVNQEDYLIWINNTCIPNSRQRCMDLRADFNKDQQVDFEDYKILKGNFGKRL